MKLQNRVHSDFIKRVDGRPTDLGLQRRFVRC